jgi:hypothetical protein
MDKGAARRTLEPASRARGHADSTDKRGEVHPVPINHASNKLKKQNPKYQYDTPDKRKMRGEARGCAVRLGLSIGRSMRRFASFLHVHRSRKTPSTEKIRCMSMQRWTLLSVNGKGSSSLPIGKMAIFFSAKS